MRQGSNNLSGGKEKQREQRNTNHAGEAMSLDFYLEQEVTETESVYEANITHNLGAMASEAGLYYPLWHPDEGGITTAKQLIPLLEFGLVVLKNNPAKFKKHNPENGWGNYDNLFNFTRRTLEACIANPDALVRTST